jgi:SAM-dependent methyltransferase
MKTITHNNKVYPAFQATGNAARFALPFAKEICVGEGFDIGCNRPEWAFPGAEMIDLVFGTDAMALPDKKVDYIFSSHCLEHLPDWVGALNHWRARLKPGGQLFLYLPHEDQSYWAPWSNRKHFHSFRPKLIRKFLEETGWLNIHVSQRDLNHAFIATATNPHV